jgi:hypothetical protein
MRAIAMLTVLVLPLQAGLSRAAEIDFIRDIRPIFADKCYACHGPDESQRQGGDASTGGLHFDSKQGAFADLGGSFAIVPKHPEASELIRRIHSTDPDEVMPPADYPKKLSVEEQNALAEWIRSGAPWKDHWAYLSPTAHPAPQVQRRDWPQNYIDNFVLARLERDGIEPSAESDTRTLLRRLCFDLVGLPPTKEQLQDFLNNDSPEAYEAAVDGLLRSLHYGERMAMSWLDLVRYADTVGYHGDQNVSVSPYRDYVIDAFNRNMRFDRFTREQLAGDLLDEPTQDQLIASGYNRLGMMSAEGGVQPKEYLAKYASDRVRTASAVWLGSTVGCAECHDHKFDPFTSADFYRFASFFADIKEKGLYAGAHASGIWGPSVELPDERLPALLEPIDHRLAKLQETVDTPTEELAAAQRQWELDREKSSPAGASALPKEIVSVLAIAGADRNEGQAKTLAVYYRSIAPSLADVRHQVEQLTKQKVELTKKHSRTSLITVAVTPRTMRLLPRGNWLDDSGPIVEPGVPHFLRQISKQDRANRKDLAEWLTAADNPLTARVFVNRLWKLYFGAGLSKVLDDIGSQGEPPTHAQLLDRLAVEFVESGWDVKHMVKLIVMSATYRQSSQSREELGELDPYNRLLARQARFRLDAEMIRDNALATSGLLVRKIGGRSVKPYQPPGLYRHLNFPAREYQHDLGESQYRRGVYTHWQRQFLHPAMKAFDAPPREECVAERARSNTPLAALVLLNDPSYVEAARVFAARIVTEKPGDFSQRLSWAMRQALSRPPNERETDILRELWQSQREQYGRQLEDAEKLVSTGLSSTEHDLDRAELAAWTAVARTIFNLHEFITRN